MPLLELRNVRKSFGPAEVLKGASLTIHAGQVSALVGDNGAGKSTLIKGLAGVQPYDSGQVLLEGVPVKLTSPQTAAELGIGVIYQDLALCENLDIVENLFLGREATRHHMLNRAAMEQQAAAILLGLSVRNIRSVRQRVSSLSGGERQVVAIARVVLQQARVLILDEPTAALGITQTAQVLTLIRRLADAGVGVLMISHNLADVFQVCDHINVLYLGRLVAQLETSATSYDDVVGYKLGNFAWLQPEVTGSGAALDDVFPDAFRAPSGPSSVPGVGRRAAGTLTGPTGS